MKKNLFFLFALLGILSGGNVISQEYELYDDTFTFTYDECRDDAAISFLPFEGLPSDWTNSPDYYNGTLYVRYEIKNQPSTSEAQILIALYQDRNQEVNPTYWKESIINPITIGGSGDIGTNSYVPNAFGCWGTAGECVDLSRADDIYKYEFQIWGQDNKIKKGNPDWVDSANYFPMTVRATLVLVANAGSFSGWDYWLNNIPSHMPNYSIDYANERTAEFVTSIDQYSTDQSTWTTGTGAYVNLTPGQTVYFRDISTPSNIQTLVVPNRLAGPSYTIDYFNEKTIENIPATVEYSTNSSMTSANAGANSKITLTPGTDLYFRFKATSSSFSSSVFHLDVQSRPSAPVFTLNTNTFKTNEIVPSTTEYKTSLTSWSAGTGVQLSLTPGTDVNFRYKATSSAFSSEIQTLVVPAIGVPSYTINFILEKTNEDGSTLDEYSTDLASWSSGNGSKLELIPGTDLYIRRKADNTKMQHLVVPVRPATPAYSINYNTETTSQVIATTDEYSSEQVMNGAISGSGNTLTLIPGIDVFLRTKATNTSFASAVQHLIVPVRPLKPSFTISYTIEKTVEIVPVNVECSQNSSMSSSIAGTGASIPVTPGTNLYFRIKSSEGTFASEVFELIVPSRPDSPVVTIDYFNEKTNQSIASTIEYSDNSAMTGSSSGSGTKLIVTPGIDIYFRVKSTSVNFASSVNHVIVSERPSNPSFTIDFVNVQTNEVVPASVSYSTNENFTSSNSGSGLKLNLSPGSDIYFKKNASLSSFASGIQYLDVPARPVLISAERDSTKNYPFSMNVIFGSSVTGFSAEDILVTNGVAKNLSVNKADIYPASKGIVTVNIPANVVDGGNFSSNTFSIEFKGEVSGVEYEKINIKIYPNPSSGVLYFDYSTNEKVTISVYLMDGTLVKSIENSKNFIDLTDISGGTYFVKIQIGQKSVSKKIILL